MKHVDLANAAWTIEAAGDRAHVPSIVGGRAFAARVPGCVHSDLVHAGAIGHPNLACHEADSQWIGRTDWRYRCRFEVNAGMLAHDRVDLVLDGLDTIATIEVNGRPAGEAMNMHHAHRLGIRPLLCAGPNNLTIDLRGPVSYVGEQEARLGRRPVNGEWTPYCYLRKMASNFQWDWGPRVATCGIWRGARLEAWSGARIAGVRPMVEHAAAGGARVAVHLEVETADNAAGAWDHAELALCGAPRGGGARGEAPWHTDTIPAGAFTNGASSSTFDLSPAALWWPRGHGPQALYELRVALFTGGRAPLDEHRLDIGLRQVRLLTPSDAHGSAFALEINGTPIFCKGANWIPEGLFPEDQSERRIRQRVQQAADAGMNMLRVWGGGTYEQDAFYHACNELGILVWQDFMFACATYPEDDPYPQLVEREARAAITRLCRHPSVVLWCGGNENLLGYESWGWKARMPPGQKWGQRYFFEILPALAKELDPTRPYWPDSPYSGARSLPANDAQHGDRHTWDARVEGYRDLVPRFCSEFGHQSPPCWATMREAWGEDQLALGSGAMVHRQRASGGNQAWYGDDVLGHRFRAPRDFDEWLYLAHLLQARALSVGMEWLRGNRPRCMGALLWQLNDAWAGHSWSCIDSAGRCKPAWYAIRRSLAPRMLTIQPLDGALRVCAVNDEAEPWEAPVRVRRVDMTGRTLAEDVEGIVAQPRAVGRLRPVTAMVGSARDERGEFIVAEIDGVQAPGGAHRAFWFFAHDGLLRMPPPVVDASLASGDDGGLVLRLRARTLLRDVVIAADRVDPAAQVHDNLITLLPGEECALRIAGPAAAGAAAATWVTPPVFRCANEFSNRA